MLSRSLSHDAGTKLIRQRSDDLPQAANLICCGQNDSTGLQLRVLKSPRMLYEGGLRRHRSGRREDKLLEKRSQVRECLLQAFLISESPLLDVFVGTEVLHVPSPITCVVRWHRLWLKWL